MPTQDFLFAARQPLGRTFIDLGFTDLTITSTAVPFDMERQQTGQWCWAATATSVSHYYWPRSTWTQCKVATAELGIDSCVDPVPKAAIQPHSLNNALVRTDNLGVKKTGPLRAEEVRAELAAGRVVAVHVKWRRGGGHAVVIHGWGKIGPTEYFDIADPHHEPSYVPVEEFTSNYRGDGTWANSYLTRKRLDLHVEIPKTIDPEWFDLIRLARPLVVAPQLQPAVRGDTGRSEIAAPHDVFVIGLLDLIEKANPMPDTPSASRLIEIEGEQLLALYELSPPGAAKRNLRSVSNDQRALERIQRALSAATRSTGSRDGTAELRLLRVPALYVEAFLLHYSAGGDTAIILSDGDLSLPEEMPLDALLGTLRTAAQERLALSRDADDDVVP